MSNVARYALPVLNARLTAILHAIDAATTPGYITVYSGTPPAVAGGPLLPNNVSLVTYHLSKPAGAVTNGVLEFVQPNEQMCTGDGLAFWARVYDGADNAIMDMTVGDMASSAALRLGQLNLYAGASLLRPSVAKIAGG